MIKVTLLLHIKNDPNPPYFAHKSRTIKLYSKQYITVDNTHQLLYTVYRKGEKKICILY